MSRTYAKTTARLNGKSRTHTVRIEACDGIVLCTAQDETSAMSHLSRHTSGDPQRDAGRMVRDLLGDGYRES